MFDKNDDEIQRLTLAALGLAPPEEVERFRRELAQYPELGKRRRNAERRDRREPQRRIRYPRQKRALDLVLSLTLLSLLFPLILLAALLVRISDPGPAFFQLGVFGKGGKPFFLYRIRCMYEKMSVGEPTNQNRPAASQVDGPIFRLLPDPRIIPTLRWVRRLGIDRLPALWNVVCSDMSLVGPPPSFQHVVQLVCSTDSNYADQFEVLPGIFSLQSVLFAHHDNWEFGLKTDLYYVRHASISLDLRILIAAALISVRVPRGVVLRLLRLPAPEILLRAQAIEDPEVTEVFEGFLVNYAELAMALG